MLNLVVSVVDHVFFIHRFESMRLLQRFKLLFGWPFNINCVQDLSYVIIISNPWISLFVHYGQQL